MATHEIWIPRWRPPLANAWKGRHWAVAHRLRKQATRVLACYAQAARVPAATGRRSVALLVRLGPRQKQWDRDAADKLLLDALVRAGLLVDDSERSGCRCGVSARRRPANPGIRCSCEPISP